MLIGGRLHRFTPLIVCGRQRAGTRYVTNLLNSFPRVTLQGEIPNTVMAAMERFLAEVDAFYEERAGLGEPRHEKQRRNWLRKKGPLIFALWSSIGQDTFIPAHPECRYFGYKRPNNEHYFDLYEAAFEEKPPVYVFCVRNFADNYLSIKSRWRERTIEQVADDYLASLNQYARMSAAAPDRVLLVNLDDMKREGFSYFERRVVRPLGLKLNDERRAELSQLGPVNRTEHDNAMPRRRTLDAAEQAYIQSRPELDAAFAALCEADPGHD